MGFSEGRGIIKANFSLLGQRGFYFYLGRVWD